MKNRPSTSGWYARKALRVIAMARKETYHIMRDPRSIVMAFGLPIALLVLFGYGVSFNFDNIPLVISDQDGSAASRQLVRAFEAGGEFRLTGWMNEPNQALDFFRRNEAAAALIIPNGYGERLAQGERSSAQILVDASDGTLASTVLGSAAGIVQAESAHLQAMGGRDLPIQVRSNLLYNPALRSEYFFVPGLIAYIMAISCVLLTALSIAKEWERGNMEQLFATPVTCVEIIIGKICPYLVVGLAQALLVVTIGLTVFDVPLIGGFWNLAFSSTLFLIAMLGQGLFISVITKNQQLATMAGAISTLLPTLLLSGFLFPIANMPLFLQGVSMLFPARYFMEILRGVFLKGIGIDILWPQYIGLLVFDVLFLALSVKRFGRRIA